MCVFNGVRICLNQITRMVSSCQSSELLTGGALRHNPLVQGLLILANAQFQRAQRGVTSMKNLKLSEHENGVVNITSEILADAGCNKSLMRSLRSSFLVSDVFEPSPFFFVGVVDVFVIKYVAMVMGIVEP